MRGLLRERRDGLLPGPRLGDARARTGSVCRVPLRHQWTAPSPRQRPARRAAALQLTEHQRRAKGQYAGSGPSARPVGRARAGGDP